MVTAKRLFQGEDLTETLANVMKAPADLSAAPVNLRRLLTRCLEKDPKKRLRDIGDVWALLDEQQQAPVVAARSGGLAVKVWAAVATLALAGLAAVLLTKSPPETPLRRFSLNTPPNLDNHSIGSAPSISPNGKHVAFVTTGADSRLWVQDLDQDEPRELPDTKAATRPFWSPDSESIGFATATELRKISVRGGASGRICVLSAQSYGGGSWSPDGKSIVFPAGGSLVEVPADGGDPKPLIAPNSLPGGAASDRLNLPSYAPANSGPILLFGKFAVGSTTGTMFARNLRTGKTADLGTGFRPTYSPSTGHLIYQTQFDVDDLWARPLSLDTLQFTGPAFSVRRSALGHSLSKDGTLAYQSGAGNREREMRTLVWREIGRAHV